MASGTSTVHLAYVREGAGHALIGASRPAQHGQQPKRLVGGGVAQRRGAEQVAEPGGGDRLGFPDVEAGVVHMKIGCGVTVVSEMGRVAFPAIEAQVG